MVIIKDFDAPRNCVNCQNEGLSEIVGCGLFDEWGKHPDCPFIEVKGMEENFKIGQEVFIHGYVDEIRKDVIIIRNEGGYFGTVKEEIIYTKTKNG